MQLGQLQEEGETAPSQSRRPAEDHLPFPSSTSQLGPAKDEEFADALQDSNPAHDLLPVPPSIFDEGGTIPSQDLNSAPELATAPLSIQKCQVKERSITTLSQESMLVQKLALPPSSETIDWTWCSPTQNGPSSHPPIHRLLLQLLANPGLAASVKHLSFSGRFAIRTQAPAPMKLNKRDMKALQDMILEMELPMAPLWMEALELGTINVFVALILSQLVNQQPQNKNDVA